MKATLKRLLGPGWQRRLHRLGRIRWITKWRLMRMSEERLRDHPIRNLRYLLLDPELESWTYSLANEAEVVAAVAGGLGVPRAEIERYAAEAHADPELHARLWRRTRRRLDIKTRQRIGNRFAWYLLTRALKPEVVVETGIYLGLGSLVVLRALERNAQEGVEGELLSFDLSDDAGWLVREDLRGRWTRVIGPTQDTIADALRGRRVGLMFQDSLHHPEFQSVEFAAALDNAAERLVLLECSGGWARTLLQLCEEHRVEYHLVPLRPADHFVRSGFAFAVFDRVPGAAAPGRGLPAGQAGR